MAQDDMAKLLEQSASTDIKVLLTAKENAKRAVLDDPSPANLAALERASKLVEGAMQAQNNFRDYRAVLAYAEECGRKVKRSKLYNDITAGRLKKQPDGSFRQRDVDRYFASLPMSGTPDIVAEKAADRQRRREEHEIRRLKAVADREEFDLAVKKGRYVPRDEVHAGLAARAVTLSAGLKTAFEAKSLDIVGIVEGNPKKAPRLVEFIESLLDEAFNEYSREMEFEVELIDDEAPDSEKKGEE